MTETLTVAAAQFEVAESPDFGAFAEQVTACLDASAGAQLVVFGELMTTGLATTRPGWRSADLPDLFARVPGFTDDYLALFTTEARAREQVVVGGSHLVDAPCGLLNVAHVFFPDGRVERHAKTLLFPAERIWRTVEGDDYRVLDVDGVGVGIATCYEAEVPEIPSILAARGAEVLVVPSYTFTEAGFHRVRHSVAARCVENQVLAVHCSTYAADLAPLAPAWARSSVLAPPDTGFPADGVVAEAGTNRREVIVATLDLAALREVRRSGAAPTWHDRHRRADLFAAHGVTGLPAPAVR